MISKSETGYSSLKRGKDFEKMVSKSFSQIKCFIFRLYEGSGVEMPADFLVSGTSADYLIECKSTTGDKFVSSLTKKHQIRGLVDFRNVEPRRHKSYLFIEFSSLNKYIAIEIHKYLSLIRSSKKLSHTFYELKANGKELHKFTADTLDITEIA